MTEIAESFPPIVGTEVHTLILGTVPGQASLKSAQYYAHPRNAFWPIMMAMIGKQQPCYEAQQSMGYTQRCQLISEHGYAVWDVLASCTRPGSLDSKIIKSTELPNDIASLVQSHPELTRIVCNGRTAENLFKRHILKSLPRPVHLLDKHINNPEDEPPAEAIRLVSLPSTSPAMASLTLANKYQVWAEGLLG